jgi:hypothetical protein
MFGGVVHKETFKFATNHLESSQTIFSDTFQSILFCFNPNANFSESNIRKFKYAAQQLSKMHPCEITYLRELEALKNEFINNPPKEAILCADGEGLVTDFVNKTLTLRDSARNFYNSENYLKRHVASRLTYASLALSSLITRIIDFTVGLIAAIVSLSIFGTCQFLNSLAYRELTGSALIHDLSFCLARIINPWAGTSPRS